MSTTTEIVLSALVLLGAAFTFIGYSLHEILVTLFLFITAPISAHLLAKAALHLGLK